MKSAIPSVFNHLYVYLNAVTPYQYTSQIPTLTNSTIGQHTRHIVEFFVCLLDQEAHETINYDLRKRNSRLEIDPIFAIETIKKIEAGIGDLSFDKVVMLQTLYQEAPIPTTIQREIAYLLEHTIHHLAMVRIGINEAAPQLQLPVDFGVAKSTVIARQNSLTT